MTNAEIIKTKLCTGCQTIKSVDEYWKNKKKHDGLERICIICLKKDRKIRYKNRTEEQIVNTKKTRKLYAENNKEKLKVWLKEYSKTLEAREKAKINQARYRLNNAEKVREYNKAAKAKVRKENPERLYKINLKYRKKKFAEDPIYRFKVYIRHNVHRGFKAVGEKKCRSTEKILCISLEEFKTYIESKFKDGMTWENYGLRGWHLDHIIPLSTAKTKEEVIALSHYTNFQPLWWRDNICKSNKIEYIL